VLSSGYVPGGVHIRAENKGVWKLEEKIEDFLKDILDNKSEYLEKKENLKKLNYQNTWINVNQKILKTINEN